MKSTPLLFAGNLEHDATNDWAAKLLGRPNWQAILEIEEQSKHWVKYGVGHEHSYGRLPGEEEIHAWPIPRSTGFFLHWLICHEKLQRGLEIGTSLAYSTVFLGAAFDANSGSLVTCEIFPPKIKDARKNLGRSGLKNVRLIAGDALTTAFEWSQPLDFIFLDADPENYLHYLSALERHVASGGLLVMDNAVDHFFVTHPLINRIANSPAWVSSVLPFDHGLLIARKR